MKTTIKLIALSFLLFASQAKAQLGLIAWGGQVGIATGTVKISDINDTLIKSTIEGKGVLSYNIGLFLRVGAGPVYGKVKGLYEYQSGKVEYTVAAGEQSVSFNSSKIMVPLLFGYKFLPPVLGIEAGPVFNYLLSATKDFSGTKVDVSKGGLGYRIGLNAQVKMLNFTVSYQGIKNGSSTTLSSFQTPNQMIFEFGVAF